MLINYTLSGSITVPEGSTLNDHNSGIILPDGQTLKIWEALELTAADDDHHRDIGMVEALDMGIHYDGDMCRFEVVE